MRGLLPIYLSIFMLLFYEDVGEKKYLFHKHSKHQMSRFCAQAAKLGTLQ